MGIVIRQSIKASIVTYIGAVIGYLNVVFITPYCLPPSIVGLGKVFIDLGFFLTFFAQLGLSSGIVRFFPFFKDNKNNHGFFFLVMVLPLAGMLVFGLSYLFLKNWLTHYFVANSELLTHYLNYILPLTLVLVYLNICEIYTSCLLRIVVPKLIREIILRILNIWIILLFFFKIISLDQYMISIIGINGIALLLNFIYLAKISKLSLKPDFSFLNKSLIKQISTYLLFIMLGGIGTNLVSKFDVLMISSSINLTNTGIFTIAFYITSIIEIPSRSILQISAPLVSDALKNNHFEKLKDIYRKSSLNQFILGSFVLLLVWINVDNIFRIMPNGALYSQGKYVILLIGIGKMFDMITGVNGVIVSNSKYYYYSLFFILYLTLVSVGLNLLLIPKIGIVGAAIASLVAIATYNLLLVLFLQLKMQIQPFTINTLKALFVSVIPFVLNYFLPVYKSPFIDGLYRTFLVATVFILILLFLKVSDDINDQWKNILNGKFFKDLSSTFKL